MFSASLTLVSEFEGGGSLYKTGPVSVLQLHGSHYQMGRQYGVLMRNELTTLYTLVVAKFLDKGFTYD